MGATHPHLHVRGRRTGCKNSAECGCSGNGCRTRIIKYSGPSKLWEEQCISTMERSLGEAGGTALPPVQTKATYGPLDTGGRELGIQETWGTSPAPRRQHRSRPAWGPRLGCILPVNISGRSCQGIGDGVSPLPPPPASHGTNGERVARLLPPPPFASRCMGAGGGD